MGQMKALAPVLAAVLLVGCGSSGPTASPAGGGAGPTPSPPGGGAGTGGAGSAGAPASAATAPASSACPTSGPVSPGRYSGTVSYKVHFATSVGSISSTTDVNGTGPITFAVDPSGGVAGTWSLAETGTSTTGTTQTKISGSLSNGPVGGTTAALTLGGTLGMSEQLIVNGVAGPLATQSVPFSGGTGYQLHATCTGGAAADLQLPSAGADIRIDANRTGS